MKNIICYCTGGLGNRLRSLSSCYAISKTTNRNLIVVWPSTIRCRANFLELFESVDFTLIDETELYHFENNCKIYGLNDSVYNEKSIYGFSTIGNIVSKNGITHIDQFPVHYNEFDNVIVITNNFIKTADVIIENYFLRNIITPIAPIMEQINHEQKYLNLNDNVIGVHARGTDFFIGSEYYINLITAWTKPESKLFLCSDSKTMEQDIKGAFLDREIKCRVSKVYPDKLNPNASWLDNVDTTKESLYDAVVDMYLLSKTNFMVYNNTSSFAHIIKRLGD